jgi:hypothetical protein
MKEIWKDIPGYETSYQVSDLGRIKSFCRNKKGRILKLNLTNKGYYIIALSKDNNIKGKLVHRLVANSFIPNPFNKPQVNHKNGIKTDNNVNNLEWMTALENIRHSYDNQFIFSESGIKKLKRISLKKISIEDVIFIRNTTLRICELSRRFNISRNHIYNIKKNKTCIIDRLTPNNVEGFVKNEATRSLIISPR